MLLACFQQEVIRNIPCIIQVTVTVNNTVQFSLNMLAQVGTVKVRWDCQFDSFIRACNHNKHRSLAGVSTGFARLNKDSGLETSDTCALLKHNDSNPAKNERKQTKNIYTKSTLHAKARQIFDVLPVRVCVHSANASICHFQSSAILFSHFIHQPACSVQ